MQLVLIIQMQFLLEALQAQRRTVKDGNHTDDIAAIDSLQQAAGALEEELVTVNRTLFADIRGRIQQKTLMGTHLRAYMNQFTTYGTLACDGVYTSYDALDVLVDGIFDLRNASAPILTPTVEMVHCEETPARAILDLTDQIGFAPDDCFFDLGSGLGQVTMLVNLLTGVRCCGIEVEPAFVAFAQAQADTFGLNNITFVNEDARIADYREGTVFFLFTPFRGEMLREVLARLARVAQQHSIRIGTFGSCTPRIAEERWLRTTHPEPHHEYKLVVFESTSQ